MKLRLGAIVAWLGAICFTLFFAPNLDSDEFKSLVNDRSTITVQARVLDEPVSVKGFQGTNKLSVKIEVISPAALAGRVGSVSGPTGLSELSAGDSIRAVVSLKPAFRRDESFTASVKKVLEVTQSNDFSPIQDIREKFLENLSGVTSDSAALVAGLAIGDDSKLSTKTKEDFKIVSLTHLSAVSGANCAIVLGGVALLLNLVPLARMLRLSLSLLAILMYLALVGPEPSVLRASAMVAVVLFGFYFGRKVAPLDAISLSVIVLVCYQPGLSLDFGFALSVFATLGLLVLAPRLVTHFEKRMPTWLAVVISISLAAQIACLPILLVLKPELPVYSVLANVLAEPFVAPITVLGLLACLVAPVLPVVTTLLSQIASVLAWVIVFIGNTLASAPSPSIGWYEGLLGAALAALLVASICLYFISDRPALKRTGGVGFITIALVLFAQTSSIALQSKNFYAADYTVVNCDVGQGDALVIRSEGKVAVIDVGREDPAIDDCLTGLGISTIDLLVLTHYDMDHIGGLVGAITGRAVGTALVTSFADERSGADFTQEFLKGLDIPLVRAEVGMTGSLGAFSWLVLTPHFGAPEATDSNDASTSMLWTNEEIALVTLADLGEAGQMRIGRESSSILESQLENRFVIVKVAHHGSSDQYPELYEAIEPDVAILSVGIQNSYGHPTGKTLDLLQRVGAEILRTDQQGSLGIIEDEGELSVHYSGRS